MYSSIFGRIRRIIAEVAGVRSHIVTTNTYFDDDLGMNDDNLRELGLRIKDEFDIHVPKKIFKEFNTVGEIVGFIEAEMGR